MTPRLRTIAALVFVHALWGSAWGQDSNDWVDVRGPSELRTLMSNKSFKDGWGTIRAFRSDGKGLFVMSSGERIPNTWSIHGTKEICATPQKGDAECWSVRRHRRDTTMVRFTFDNGVIVSYQINDGVPDF